MKRIIALLLVLALMMGALAGCGDKKDKEGQGEGQEQSQEQEGQESRDGSGEGSGETEGEGGDAEPEEKDLLSESYSELMSGHWDYINPYDHSVSMQFDFDADGSYRASRRSGISGKTVSYEGKWIAAEVPVAAQYASVMVPLLSMTLEKTDDEAMSSFSSLGEFIIDAKAVCDGRYVVYLVQYNNGDSVLSMAYDTYTAVLTRTDGAYVPEASESVKKGEHFAAFCWKLEGDENGALLWLDDRDLDTTKPVGKDEAVGYRFADDAQIYMNTDYILGGELVELETNEKGEISAIGMLIRGYEDPDDIYPEIEYFIEGKQLSFENEEGDLTIARSSYEVITPDTEGYPELEKALEAYDAEVADYAEQMGRQLVEGVSDMEPEHLKEIAPLVSEIRIRVHRSDEKVFSFAQYHYYYGGGPHPYEQYSYVNIDPLTGKVLTEDDIILDRDRFMRLITDEIKRNWEYIEKLPDEIGELMVEEGGVTVLYNTYELGSYAAGGQELFFSLETLGDIVNRDLFIL